MRALAAACVLLAVLATGLGLRCRQLEGAVEAARLRDNRTHAHYMKALNWTVFRCNEYYAGTTALPRWHPEELVPPMSQQ